jgi:8-oxo-dGTP pyrophosphatase MutT (NUDIX family)
MDDRLPQLLAARLERPLPGRAAQREFEPELSYGRHYAPAPAETRAAAVIALLYPSDDGWLLPLIVRPQTMTDHAGQVSLPGGMIDQGESPASAATRELEEELGVDRHSVRIVGQLSPIYLFVSNFSVQAWVGFLGQRPRLTPNPHEVAELLETPLAHLVDKTNYGRHARDFNGLQFGVPHIRFKTHYVWGATAMILAELIAMVRELEDAAVC